MSKEINIDPNWTVQEYNRETLPLRLALSEGKIVECSKFSETLIGSYMWVESELNRSAGANFTPGACYRVKPESKTTELGPKDIPRDRLVWIRENDCNPDDGALIITGVYNNGVRVDDSVGKNCPIGYNYLRRCYKISYDGCENWVTPEKGVE